MAFNKTQTPFFLSVVCFCFQRQFFDVYFHCGTRPLSYDHNFKSMILNGRRMKSLLIFVIVCLPHYKLTLIGLKTAVNQLYTLSKSKRQIRCGV